MTKDELIKENMRLSNLLHDWIAAAQSGDGRFGRLLQEPRPFRLREAIAKAIKQQDELEKAEAEVRQLKSNWDELKSFVKKITGSHLGAYLVLQRMNVYKKIDD